MEHNEISFENLPHAVAHLNNQVEELKAFLQICLKKRSTFLKKLKNTSNLFFLEASGF